MAMIGMAAGLVGSAVSAMGAMQQANAQANAKNASALAERVKGTQEAAVSQRDALQKEAEMNRVLSDQRAGFASAGGGLGGSAYVVADQTASKGIQNRDAKIWEGEEARRSRESQAKIYEMEAKALKKAGAIGAASAIIGGVSGAFKGGGSFGGSSGGGGSYFYG